MYAVVLTWPLPYLVMTLLINVLWLPMGISHSMQNSSSLGISDTDNIGKATYPSLVLVIATAAHPPTFLLSPHSKRTRRAIKPPPAWSSVAPMARRDLAESTETLNDVGSIHTLWT
ncbi:putative pyridoxal 5'-phosphate synthase subunit PDX2 [Fusarium oxysporum f. sp. albedinis]|nr:putative pyridoxal 5'-phosphate synthase subunit PDX2 [Fusarium oxysporum f. sp. albedinis]